MALTQERKGEIALALLGYQLRRENINLDPASVKRKIGNLSKEVSIPKDELNEFGREMIQDLVNKSFDGK